MLLFRIIALFLWLIAVVSISNAGEIETPGKVAESPTGVKTAFARHAMEISDLLRMFTTLINKADEEEGRELGLPEITSTIPPNLESASIEELFDRFETAAQSFRTRFLKYLKTTETPYSSIAPTASTIVELSKEGEKSRLVYEYENAAEVDSLPDSETEYSASTVSPREDNDSKSEKTTVAFILSNSEVSDIELEPEYSTSTAIPDIDDSGISNGKSSVAFILTNEEVPDSEMETDYRASTAIPDSSDYNSSGDTTTLAFILSNTEELNQESDGDASFVEKLTDKDVILTLVPITQGSSESFIGESTSESFLDEDFKTPAEKFGTEITFDHEASADLNGKSQFIPTNDKFTNGATTLILESVEDEDAKTLFSKTTDDSNEVKTTSFTATDDSSEEYTLMTFSTTEDYDSDEETKEIDSSTKIDSASEIAEISTTYASEGVGEFVSTTDDSDEETSEFVSTTDESGEETEEVVSTADNSDEETSKIFPTADDSGEETREIFLTTDDSDEETGEIFLTTKEYSDEAAKIHSTTEESEELDESTVDEMSELVKILREADKKYDILESDKRANFEDARSSEKLSDSEFFSEQISKVPKPSIQYVITSVSSENGKTVNERSSLKASLPRKNSKIMDNLENFSKRMGLMHERSVYSHLDVVGVPGENYPNSLYIPATSFTCEGKESPGLYADLETRCQVFHVCWPHRMESYLCPVGSTFHQEILSCDYWYNSTCSRSPDYYGVNLRLKDYITQFDDELYEDSVKKNIYPYSFQSDFSRPIFNEMKFLPFKYEIINYSVKGRGIESGREIDYNETIQIEFDQNSTLPTIEDTEQQETTDDLVDSVKDRFRELLRSFVESENSKNAESSDDSEESSVDSSLHKMKLQERKYIYEKMSKSKVGRSGILLEGKTEEGLEAETTSPISTENHAILNKSTNLKIDKKQIAPAIVFKALETAENVVTKGILPMTRDLLAANYIKLYKKKKL